MTSTASAMKSAVALARTSGYQVEDVPKLKGAEWHQLLEKATDQKVRDAVQALRWTKGDLPKLYADRDRQRYEGKTYEVLTRCQLPQGKEERRACRKQWAERYPAVSFALVRNTRRPHLPYSAFYEVFHAR